MTIDDRLPEYPFEPFRGELPESLLNMVTTEPISRVRLPDGRPVWLVLGYDEVCTVLSDARFTRYGVRHAVPEVRDGECPVRELNMDGPAHTSLRRLASRAFTPRRVESYRPRVLRITEELLDAMEAAGPPADVISGLVNPMPALVVCEVLGVPAEDRERFNAWAADMFAVTAYGSPAADRARAELRAYLAERLAAKRREPGDDLLSDWIAAEAEGRLTEEEIIGLALAVLIGGREINSISVGLRALFQHPDELARLRAEPALLPAAVEEILRYTSVSPMFVVQAVVEDLELCGVTMRAGDAVMAVPWAANRHPEVFPSPGAFTVDRPNNPHLAFGYGPHFCLGAALGRLEVEIAVGALLRRFPGLAPAVPIDELPWRQERLNCGIAEFPITW